MSPSLSPVERARLYARAMPSAISGSGGHSQTFALAVALAHGFNLHESDCWVILLEYNATCQPPWGEGQLRHKMKDAYNTEHTKPRGWLLGDDTMLEPRRMDATKGTSVTQSGKVKVNLGAVPAVPKVLGYALTLPKKATSLAVTTALPTSATFLSSSTLARRRSSSPSSSRATSLLPPLPTAVASPCTLGCVSTHEILRNGRFADRRCSTIFPITNQMR